MSRRHRQRKSTAPASAPEIDDLRLDELSRRAPIAAEPVASPRRFGKPRVYHLDGGFRVTITGDEDALEGDFALSSENDSLLIFTGDAAIQRRIARQQTAAEQQPIATPHLDRFVQTSGRRSLSASAPAEVGAPVAHPERAYDGIGPRPRDMQEQVLAETGMALGELGASMGLVEG